MENLVENNLNSLIVQNIPDYLGKIFAYLDKVEFIAIATFCDSRRQTVGYFDKSNINHGLKG